MTDTTQADQLSDAELEAMSDQEIDALVARQDTYTRMMDEAGICRLARDYRTYQRRIAGDRAWQRYRMVDAMVAERPVNAPRPAIARRWDWHGNRSELTAPSDALLVDSPEYRTDVYSW